MSTEAKIREEGILVVGSGIAGMSAAIEAAEAGKDVYIVEKLPYLGGRVAGLAKYFPKLCPPYCGMEINFRRIKSDHRHFKVFTTGGGRENHGASWQLRGYGSP